MIYLDHNATTPLHPEVARALGAALEEAAVNPGNPSSVHQGGRAVRLRLDRARERAAALLGCAPREVCFTGSGSEADALALRGAYRARADRSRQKVVTSLIEHPAVLQSVKALEAEGAQVVRVAPGPDGRVDPGAFIAELDGAAVASLMWANNETGVLQPVAEVARACRARGVRFHSDAVQAVGKVPVTLRDADCDLLSLSAHKFGGPAGVGLLVVRRGVNLEALVPGHQEDGRRGGTHNLPYIEALVRALELAVSEDALLAMDEQVRAQRDRLERALCTRLEGVVVNGAGAPRAPNTSNLRFAGADGEALLIGLDLAGICVSAGAACASGSLTPSHVLSAMGLSAQQAHESLRLSLGRTTTADEIDRVIDALVEQVPRARAAA
jgi:cysteine desulfurase